MGCQRALGVAFAVTFSAGVFMVALPGCALLPPNSLLDPTKLGRFAIEAREGGIRRILSPRDTPPGLANATDPTAEDLDPIYEEYRIGAGDSIALTINDYFGSGAPFSAGLQVNSIGEIRIPDLGSIRVLGLTEQELEQEVAARLQDAALLPRPIVIAFIQLKRGRIFTALGAVGGPGQYPIPDPDTRLLDVLGIIGDVSATSRRMYVDRRAEEGLEETPLEPIPAVPEPDEWVIPPPVEDDEPTPGTLLTSAGYVHQQAAGSEPPEPVTKEDLADVLSPPAAQTRPTTRETEEVLKPPFEPLIFDPQTGQVIAAEPERAEEEPEAAAPAPPPEEDLEEPFDWEDVEEYAFDQRVIAIDVRELKGGNPRYNIVVRDRDVINVPVDTGVFYLMGEVGRPGVYAFGGREITMKQAIAISGGFTPLAWPRRCEIIRREPGTDKQLTISVDLDAIFYGLEDDFYLREDDIVNVGTHIVAPFLFVIRNSFRFTYGFGFVYDRNFADKDAYSARPNPVSLELSERAQRGLPF